MCGIVATAGRAAAADEQCLTAMRDTMTHRGPDDAGLWNSPDGLVQLAHRRLAVIDLSPGGHQPMVDATGKLALVFNGEIYNYQSLRESLAGSWTFRTATDTEVILAAYARWDLQCLDHLDGMFALALYDASKRRLFVARDRAGEKPLFYSHRGGGLRLASELKALMADPEFPRELDLDALNHYAAFGHISRDLCILKGTAKLPAGWAMTYDLDANTLRRWPYWQLPAMSPPKEADAGELVERLHDLLRQSVRTRLVADVPVGILLSGGIDSSLITAAAAEAGGIPLRTFTVSFPGYGSYDEGPFARQVAEHFGTQHTELTAAEAPVEILHELSGQYDEPMGDSSMVPTYLLALEIRRHATVALGGDGGDELFGGYRAHRAAVRMAQLRRFLPGIVRRPARWMVSRMVPTGRFRKNALEALLADGPEGIVQLPMYWTLRDRQALLAPLRGRLDSSNAPEALKCSLQRQGHSALQRATALDFQTYLVDDILVKIDRASMLTSLEMRSPFLSPEMIAFAFSAVPDRLRATAGEGKILPRRLAERLLPAGMDLARKQGFSIPLDAWFHGRWGDFMSDVLGEAEPALFDRDVIARTIDRQRRGVRQTLRLFPLVMFELWRRRYNVQLPA